MPAAADRSRSRDVLERAPAFSADTYRNLPAMLRLGAGHFPEPHEKDVWLTGALSVLSASTPNLGAWHSDGWYAPNIFTCVVAPASSGKGVLKYARRMGEGVNRMLLAQSEGARELWEEAKKAKTAEPGAEPPRRSLFVGANASSAAFIRALQANDTSCVFETEIDTLVAAQSQEWGNFSDVIRKAFHHEDVLVERVGERVTLRPLLSMCLAGTPEQFLRLIGTAENGLFSRFGFYVFASDDEYRSQRPTRGSRERFDYFLQAAEDVRRMYEALAYRAGAGETRRLAVELTGGQWDEHDRLFAGALGAVDDQDRPDETKATVKRMGVVALRLATTLTAIRHYETEGQGGLSGAKVLHCTDEDAEAAMLIAGKWLEHAAMLLTHLPNAENKMMRPKRKNEELLLAALPAEFSRAEAQVAGEGMGMSTRSVDRYLKRLTEGAHLSRTGGEYGSYVKVYTNGQAVEAL